jgi:hypothetical protein
MKANKIIIILAIVGLLSPIFSLAQTESVTTPNTLEEAGKLGEKALKTAEEKLPGILERIWKEEILPFWQKMYGWFKANIWPRIEGWFKKIEIPIKKEIEKRKPAAKEEFEKEKEEMKEEAPQIGKTIWEKLKELIK